MRPAGLYPARCLPLPVSMAPVAQAGYSMTWVRQAPGNTLQVRGQAVCASIKGIPFEPCFNLDKKDERSFRGSVSGMGFAYCDFRHQGAVQMLMARAVVHPRSLHPPAQSRSADASHADVSVRVETPHVESGKIEPVKSEPKSEGASELRRSTD